MSRKLKDQSLLSTPSSRIPPGPPSVRSSVRANHEEETATQISACDLNENTESLLDIPEKMNNVEERLNELRLKLTQVDADLTNEEKFLGKSGGEATSSAKIQQLSRNKSILVLHIAELRAEKRALELQLKNEPKQEENYEQDDIEYPTLIEKFIDDQEIIEFISRLVKNLFSF